MVPPCYQVHAPFELEYYIRVEKKSELPIGIGQRGEKVKVDTNDHSQHDRTLGDVHGVRLTGIYILDTLHVHDILSGIRKGLLEKGMRMHTVVRASHIQKGRKKEGGDFVDV